MLIINPISGTLSKEELEDRVSARLESAGIETVCHRTQYPGHARELARQAIEEDYFGVIVAGGDGTVNEVGSELRGTNVAMGILPYGSGNGLARHLNISIDVEKALQVIAKCNVAECDYGTANDIPFFCTFGLGFDASVSHEFASLPTRGITTYIRSAIREYFNYNPLVYEITCGGNTIRVKAFIVAVCNASQYGNNAFIAPAASIRDGLLDIVIIHNGNPLTRTFAGVDLFTGRLDKNILIQTLRVRRATIRRLPGISHIDGEPKMMPETVHVECHQAGIKLFVDPHRPIFRPLLTPLESLRSDTAYIIKERMKELLRKIKAPFRKNC